MKKPKEVVAVFDNPTYRDRYTIVTDRKPKWRTSQGKVVEIDNLYEGIGVSEDPYSPVGVCLFVEVWYDPKGSNSHLGKEIPWKELPEDVQRAVVEHLELMKVF